jgi:hypothetical protein
VVDQALSADESISFYLPYIEQDYFAFIEFTESKECQAFEKQHNIQFELEAQFLVSSGVESAGEIVSPQLANMYFAYYNSATWQPEVHFKVASKHHRKLVQLLMLIRVESRTPMHLLPVELMFHLFLYLL